MITTIWRSAKVFGATIKIYFKTHTTYTRHFVLYMLGYPIRLTAMYYIWIQIFGNDGMNTVLPYYAVVLMLQGLMSFNSMVRQIGDMVTTGDIVLVLTRPFHLWQVLLGQSIARAMGTLILGAPIIGIIFFLSHVDVSILTLSAFIIMALLGFVMEFFLFYIIGLSAFWTDRTWGQTLLGGWLVDVLGGGLVPLFVLPVWIQNVLNKLPFVYMLYAPTTILLFPERIASFGRLIGQQCLWLIFMGLIVSLMWRKGVTRYQGYGI